METLTDVVQLDLVPLVAAALKETARLTAAVEGLGRELDRLHPRPRRTPGVAGVGQAGRPADRQTRRPD